MAEYTSTGTQGHTKQGNGSSLEGGGLTGAAGQAASGLMAQVKSRASSQVAAQQAKAADGLGTVADALRKAGNELRSHNEGLASYADMAVDELEHISSRIRDKSPGEYVNDLERFARSRPAAFVGGTFLLGLGLARFLKSTQPPRPRPYPASGAGQAGYGAYQGQRPYGTGDVRGTSGQNRGYQAPTGPQAQAGSAGSPGRTPTVASRTSTSAGSMPGSVPSLTPGTPARDSAGMSGSGHQSGGTVTGGRRDSE